MTSYSKSTYTFIVFQDLKFSTMIFIFSWSTALSMTDFSPQSPSLSVCNWNLLQHVCRGGTHFLLAQEHAGFGSNSRTKHSYSTVGNTATFRLKTNSFRSSQPELQNILDGDQGLQIFLLALSSTTTDGRSHVPNTKLY